MRLIHVADLNCFTHLKLAFIRLFLPHDHTEDRGLTGTVGPDNSNYSRRREFEI